VFASKATRSKKLVTTVFIVLCSALGMQSSNAAYYPSGPQINVPVSTVTSGGWTLCFEDGFANEIALVATMLNDCTGENIMLAGKIDNQTNIALLAAGERSVVFEVQTVANQKTLNNGTYFYFFPEGVDGAEGGTNIRSKSIGFSLSDVSRINTCDIGQVEAAYRLCRHISGNPGQAVFSMGWRIGSTLVFDNTALFQVYQQSLPDEKVAAPTPALRQTSNLSFDQSQHGSDTLSDPDGQLRKTIDSINAKYGNLIK
jgi:hypothetical protein